ncbi:MAG: type II 3-dehydroquinate dehydratase [SAR324 cluster bacterium]|nr:type II 3-dehydroquinate dehydratase [SAR324 cluster bacterium]
MAKVLLLNGPNLNLLGERQPSIYGTTTLKEIEDTVRAKVEQAGHTCVTFQSNSEGALVDWLHHERPADFLILNAAGFTHTSVALRDAVSAIAVPFVEVHISNIYKREPFRAHSYFSDIAEGVMAGLGPRGYDFAAEFALDFLKRGQ